MVITPKRAIQPEVNVRATVSAVMSGLWPASEAVEVTVGRGKGTVAEKVTRFSLYLFTFCFPFSRFVSRFYLFASRFRLLASLFAFYV